MVTDIEEFKQEIEKIKLRNGSVTMDKAWETSLTRKAFITVFTYLAVWLWLETIGVKSAYLHALVPPGAFLLSTLTMPYAKYFWLRKFYKTKEGD